MVKIEVRTRIVGCANADAKPPTIAIELLEESLTVQDLITRTIKEQVHDLLINRKIDAENILRMLDRQYLIDADVQREARRGAVKVPSTRLHPLAINIEAEVERALRGFEQKAYLMVVDGEQPDSLTDVITLRPTSKITFLRLTPLVGG
ncbi:MAG: hypothetical protein ABI700_06590 [Chloroflexota bacterium]